MGIVRAILDFFRRLFGRPQEPVLSLGTGQLANAGTPAPVVTDDDDDADDDADDATRDGQHNIEDEWADLQVLVARCEAEGIDLAGLDILDPTSFWSRQQRIEAAQRQGKAQLHCVVTAGFRSIDHWQEVSRYYQAKWSQLIRHPNGDLEIRPHPDFTAAATAHTTRSDH